MRIAFALKERILQVNWFIFQVSTLKLPLPSEAGSIWKNSNPTTSRLYHPLFRYTRVCFTGASVELVTWVIVWVPQCCANAELMSLIYVCRCIVCIFMTWGPSLKHGPRQGPLVPWSNSGMGQCSHPCWPQARQPHMTGRVGVATLLLAPVALSNLTSHFCCFFYKKDRDF